METNDVKIVEDKYNVVVDSESGGNDVNTLTPMEISTGVEKEEKDPIDKYPLFVRGWFLTKLGFTVTNHDDENNAPKLSLLEIFVVNN